MYIAHFSRSNNYGKIRVGLRLKWSFKAPFLRESAIGWILVITLVETLPSIVAFSYNIYSAEIMSAAIYFILQIIFAHIFTKYITNIIEKCYLTNIEENFEVRFWRWFNIIHLRNLINIRLISDFTTIFIVPINIFKFVHIFILFFFIIPVRNILYFLSCCYDSPSKG